MLIICSQPSHPSIDDLKKDAMTNWCVAQKCAKVPVECEQATVATGGFNSLGNQTTLQIQAVLYIQGYTGLQRSHLWEPESLSMPFRAFLDTMTKWSGAVLFIFQLWPGASDTPVDRGKWKEGAAANGAVLYLPRDLAYPPAVWALPLNANNMAAECRAGEKRSLCG